MPAMIAPPHATSGARNIAASKNQPAMNASHANIDTIAVMMSAKAITPNVMTILAATRQAKLPFSIFAPKTKPKGASAKREVIAKNPMA